MASSRAVIGDLVEAFSSDVEALCDRLCTGKMGLIDWYKAMMRLIKRLHVAAAVAAGELQSELVEARIREQFEYLEQYVLWLAEQGKIDCGPLKFRAVMYGGAAWATYWLVVEALAVEATEVRWMLTFAEHCDDCLELAARGWMSKAELHQVPGDGETECLVNCRCYLEFR